MSVPMSFKRAPDGGLIEKKTRPARISKLVRDACDLMELGKVRTWTEAAEQLNCSRAHLSRQINKEHVKAYLQQTAKQKLSHAIGRAARVKMDLLEAVSEKVRSEVASELLAMGGIQAPKQGNNTNVSVSVSAGYIVRLDGVQAEPPTIEATVAHDVDAT